MDQYVVLCDCDPNRRPTNVGYIDDDRANGGRLEVEAWPPAYFTGTRVTPMRAGHQRSSQLLKCPCCKLWVRLSDTTAAEIVDLIVRPAPDDGGTLRELWGKTLIPYEECVDEEARSAEIRDELFGDRDPHRPTDVPIVTRYARLYVIPLIELRRRVSERDKRRD